MLSVDSCFHNNPVSSNGLQAGPQSRVGVMLSHGRSQIGPISVCGVSGACPKVTLHALSGAASRLAFSSGSLRRWVVPGGSSWLAVTLTPPLSPLRRDGNCRVTPPLSVERRPLGTAGRWGLLLPG